jgi:penicillin-binding protein 1A
VNRVVVGNRRDGGWWWRLPILAIIWLVIAAPIGAGLVVSVTLRRWARDLPEIPDLDAWRTQAHLTTLITAADGTHLAELPFRDGAVFGHRTLVPLDEMPTHLVQAVLAAEDVRFFEHRGVDYRAIARAALINYQAGRTVEGASTITQQVARNLLPDEIGSARNLRRKVREALLARAIERRWSKHDVLETYLDFVFLGEGAYGFAAAARAYFAKDVNALTLAESALLAGLIQAPGRLDPYHHADVAKARRDEVLARMMRAHMIDAGTFAATTIEPIVLARLRPAFGNVVPWYAEQVRQLIKRELPDDLSRGGLVIETAALPALGTELARDVVAYAPTWSAKNPRGVVIEPQLGALLWDHRTGYVEALVGGTLWGKHRGGDQFDRMTQSCRQPGSAFKPLVYGAALDRAAITPGTALRDAPIAEYDETTNTHWKPQSHGQFRGVVLAQDAFAASLNAPAIDVFDRVGAGPIIALARKLGITSKLEAVRPLALGASCVKPIELARVFAIVARRGWAVSPRLAVRVRRGDHVLFDAAVPEDPTLDTARRFDRLAATAGADPAERVSAAGGGQLLDERVAFQLEDMMSAVISRGTAASGAAGLGRPAAGKTGTTNSNTDAWFIGFTGRELAAVWIGFDDPVTKLGTSGDGAHAALPLWMRAIRAAEGDRPRIALPGEPPSGMEQVAIDRETGLLAPPHTGGLDLWFRAGTAPTEVSGQPGTSPTDFGRTTREF